MSVDVVARRTEMVRKRVRQLVRKGASANLARLLDKVRPEEVPVLLHGLLEDEQASVFDILLEHYPENAGAVLSAMEGSDRRRMLNSLSVEDVAAMLEHVEVDDAVVLVDSLPEETRGLVLEIVDGRDISPVQDHLAYEDDTAGRIMTTEFFALPQATTVAQAITAIQGNSEVEMIFYLYVIDDEEHLVGVTSLRQLLLSPPSRQLGEIMARSVIRVGTATDQERVAELAARYDLLAIPVTDSEERLVGIVTVDDIIDVVKDEATEDFFKMVGSSDDELLYQERSWRIVGLRLPWILVNGVGLLVSGHLLTRFQVAAKEALFLLAFVPVIMGIGGNVGSQTSTVAVRSLAAGTLRRGQGTIRPFLAQQVKVGALLGAVCALLAAAAAFTFQSNPVYAGVVGLALFLVILLASLNGAVAPLAFDRLGIDPAVAASPLVTTASDITGILIYFGFALGMIDWLVR